MKRMLFNATQAEELRVAIVDGQKLVDLDIESANKEQRKGNIYKAVVTRVEPSLEACFVNYGTERHGFLPFKEISRSAIPGAEKGDFSRGRIQDVLKEGLELVVQVEKDERGNKGAALTNQVSLAGRYLVLMPNNPRGGGVSRRIEGEERNELRDALAQLEVPAGMSLIGRTAGIGRSVEELQWDLNYLLQLWTAIDGAAKGQTGAFLIYQESSLVIRAIRDYFTPDIGELLIDEPAICEQAKQFMAHVMPPNVNKVKLYTDPVPLFSRFQIEHQIESAYSRTVTLPSGGAIVIDHTEALVAIDVNSAQATKGGDIEQTAFNTNLEAAEEVARQLRLRDLGGLIVIDFIDMESGKNQREVEDRLRDSLHYDRARVQTGKISRFGLLELSRQRLQPSLGETSYITCPRCAGTGHVRSTESFALHLLRMLQEEAMKDNTGAVHLQVPVDVATFLLNEKRHDILSIEARHRVEVVLIPNMHYETPRYTLARFRHDQLNQTEPLAPSYRMVDKPAEEEEAQARNGAAAKPERAPPVVQGITPNQPAPTPAAPAVVPETGKPGLFGRIFGWLRGISAAEEAAPAEPVKKAEPRREREPRRGRDNRGERGDRESRERRPRGEKSERGERPEGREPREPREPREARGNREAREPKENREPREARETREPREPREPRGERPERQRRERPAEPQRPVDAPVLAAPQVEGAAPAESNGEDQDGRRRGRRGGRGRRGEGRPDSPNAVAEQTVDEIVSEAGGVPETSPVPAQEPVVIKMETAPQPEPIKVELAAPAEAMATPAPAPRPAQASTRLAAPDLAAAGLQLVETANAPEAETATVTEGEANQPRRRRGRARSGEGAPPAEPLQMVETKSTENAPETARVAGESPAEWGPPSNPRRRAKPKSDEAAPEEPLVLVETRSAPRNETTTS
ncbi:MAG: Rne/Rng family ribonuclease [Hydrogenophilales bacterium]|nr:Rne/Rng family ribonuclease [Hydrogenophilales bacterium]